MWLVHKPNYSILGLFLFLYTWIMILHCLIMIKIFIEIYRFYHRNYARSFRITLLFMMIQFFRNWMFPSYPTFWKWQMKCEKFMPFENEMIFVLEQNFTAISCESWDDDSDIMRWLMTFCMFWWYNVFV